MENTGQYIYIGAAIGFSLIVLFTLVLIFSKLYHRSSKSFAFVRTGGSGSKVIKDGGCFVIPVLHEIVKVNMNTLKLEVGRREKDALITFDRMRVDVSAEFYLRVKQNIESIEIAAQTLGDKTMNNIELRTLVEGKFVDALRSVASSMTMKDLHEKRADFVQKVQQAVTSDLEKNGLELETVSLTSFDQTKREFFNPDNAFDAEGLTLLTQEIEQRKKLRNDIEQDTKLEIAQKNLQTEREQMVVNQELEKAKAESAKLISFQKASQDAEVAQFEANKTKESETAKIEAEKITEQARIAKNKEIKEAEIQVERILQEATINQQRDIELAGQDKLIALAKKSEEEAAAKTSSEKARAEQVKATQEVITIEQVAEAERRQSIEVINAQSDARKEAVKIVVMADAEAEAADKQAQTLLKNANAQAEAEKVRASGITAIYEAEAAGKALLFEAGNKQSSESMKLTMQTQLIGKLPEIIRESVKPMENIESIRIVDMGNGGVSNLSQGTEEGTNNTGGTPSLPDQFVNAALRHRGQAALMDNLMESVGISNGGNTQDLITQSLGLPNNKNTKSTKQ